MIGTGIDVLTGVVGVVDVLGVVGVVDGVGVVVELDPDELTISVVLALAPPQEIVKTVVTVGAADCDQLDCFAPEKGAYAGTAEAAHDDDELLHISVV